MTLTLTLRTLDAGDVPSTGAIGSGPPPVAPAKPPTAGYRFRTRSCGDVVLSAATGERILLVLGLAGAYGGVIAPEDAPAALARLAEAIRREDALAPPAGAPWRHDPLPWHGPAVAPAEPLASLGYQAWSLLGMLRVASASRERIVWSA